MALAEIKDQIEQLPADEQLRLVEEVWNRLASDPRDVPVPTEHLDELQRRLAEHDAAPDDVIAWDDLKDELRS